MTFVRGPVSLHGPAIAARIRTAIGSAPAASSGEARETDPDRAWAELEKLDLPPELTIGYRHNPERLHPCDFSCGGTWVCIRCRAEWAGDTVPHNCASPPPPAWRERCEHFGTEHAEEGGQCELPDCHGGPHRFELHAPPDYEPGKEPKP